MRTVTAARYVTPLREGGSLPAIVEGDDDGLYVLKFRGAGQGPKALVAELICGELARTAGLRVPEIVLMTLDPELARTEPDPEIQELIRASAGLNLALDYLPGSITFDPVSYQPDAREASSIVWFDAYVTNIDRTVRNTNMLVWHRHLWLIDHGAALYFHHAWNSSDDRSGSPFVMIRDHVLLKQATDLSEIDRVMKTTITHDEIARIVALVPAEWLAAAEPERLVEQHRTDYVDYLTRRLAASSRFVEEAERARTAHV